jgi:hypothetical protein
MRTCARLESGNRPCNGRMAVSMIINEQIKNVKQFQTAIVSLSEKRTGLEAVLHVTPRNFISYCGFSCCVWSNRTKMIDLTVTEPLLHD